MGSRLEGMVEVLGMACSKQCEGAYQSYVGGVSREAGRTVGAPNVKAGKGRASRPL